MGIGIGIFLIVVGAILAFAVGPDVWDVVNLEMVGFICMSAGVLALILGVIMNAQRSNTTHREVVERHTDVRERPGDTRPPVV